MDFKEFKKRVLDLLEKDQKDYTGKDNGEIEQLANVIGYPLPECTCHDKWHDLLIKLAIFCKQHPYGFPTFEIDRGIIYRRKDDNALISYYTLTNELAEWALENEPEAKKHIRKIGNVETAEAVETETETEDENVSRETGTETEEKEEETSENVSRETSTKKRTYNKKSK